MAHRFTKVFTTMCGNKNCTLIWIECINSRIIKDIIIFYRCI